MEHEPGSAAPEARDWSRGFARVRRAAMVCYLVTGACHDAPGPPVVSSGVDCRSIVVIQVSTEVAPLFSWQPQCLVNTLAVTDTGTGETAWFVTKPMVGNELAPPIRYGMAPAGAFTGGPPARLRAGTVYRVTLIRSEGNIGIFLGSETFTGLGFSSGR